MTAAATATGPAEPLLRCRDLVVGHSGRGLLPPIELALRPGELTLVVGRNGAGKSTWMKTALGLLRPVSGSVERAAGVRQAYVPQADGIDDLLPVRAETLVSWSRLRGWSFLSPWSPAADRRAARDALAGEDGVAGREYRQLSGGQRQKVLLARVLAGDAGLVFLDEPTAALDIASEERAYERLARLRDERRLAVVIITHTIAAVARHADQVLFVDRCEDGRSIARAGAPAEIFAHPEFRRHFGEVQA